MLRKLIFLINPIAGTRNKSASLEIIRRQTTRRGFKHEVLDTNATGEYGYLPRKIEADQVTDVVVCGGDGTINAVASALFGTNVNIGVLPMGSGNGLANSVGIPKQIGKALDIIFDGTPSYINGFFINNRFSCMLCGIGFDAKIAHEFSEQPKRGLQTYVKLTMLNYFSAKPYLFDIQLEDKSFSTEAFLISIANSNQFGNNFTIAPRASLVDGLLDIVIVTRMNKLLLPFSILSQVTGLNARQDVSSELGKNNIIYFQASSLTIINKNLAPLHIDGDPGTTAERFEIRVVEQAFKLIQP